MANRRLPAKLNALSAVGSSAVLGHMVSLLILAFLKSQPLNLLAGRMPEISKCNQSTTGTHARWIIETALDCLREVSRIRKYCADLITNKNDCPTTRASRETERTLTGTTLAARCLQVPDGLSNFHARSVA